MITASTTKVAGSGYGHRGWRCDAKEYAHRNPDGVCVDGNTNEGIWSGLHNFLDRFQGISQRFLHSRMVGYDVSA